MKYNECIYNIYSQKATDFESLFIIYPIYVFYN